ncbi:hypothetical protein ACOMHN_056712 [Nucella lapillus]
MVLMTLRLKLKKNHKPNNPRLRFDIEKLKDPEIAAAIKAKIGGRFAALNLLQDDINSLTDNIREVLHETATEVPGKRRKKNKPWVTEDILDLCDSRRELKKKKRSDQAQHYNIINKNIRAKMKDAKENWITEQCNNIDKGMREGNSKVAFKSLKTLSKIQQAKSSVIKDNNGSLLTEETEVLRRWTEYCQELYNYELKPDTSFLKNASNTNTEAKDSPILQEEVEKAVHSLKNDKSPVLDNTPAELLKRGRPELLKALNTICPRIWDTKQWPAEWTQSLIIPIPKKDNLKHQNYRTISVISHPSKVMLHVLLNRLKGKSEEILAEEQAGFRPKRSTVEQIFNIRILIEKHLQH